MKKFKTYTSDIIVIIFLSIHLFITHSKLLLHLNPDRILENLNYTLTLDLFSVGYRVSTLTSIVFSLITAYVLARFVKYKNLFIPVVVSFAILDGLGVIIYYDVNIEEKLFRSFGAFYYGIYTAVLIICYGIYRSNKYKDAELNNIQDYAKVNKKYTPVNSSYSIEDNIMSLDREGWSQTKIAKELNISQPKVSRVLNPKKNK